MLKLTTKQTLFTWIVLSCAYLSAQDRRDQLGHVYELNRNSVIMDVRGEALSTDQLRELFDPDIFHFRDHKGDILAEELRLNQKDWGLNFLSSYTRNFGEGFNDETENFTQDRFSMELQWNLLSNGYRDGKITRQIARNDLRIHELEETSYLKQREYGYQYNTIIYLFNQAKTDYLKSRLDALTQQDELLYQLYLDHLIPYIEVLKVRKKVSKYALLLEDYQDFNQEFERLYEGGFSLDASKLPVYKLLIDQLLENSHLETISEQLLASRNENVLLKNKLQEDIRFRVFARRTYTAGALDGFERNFNSLGVGLNVPISSLLQSRKKLVELELNQNLQDHEYEIYHLKKELMNYYYEYEYKLQQYQQMSLEAQRLDEIIRKDQLKEQDTTFHISRINSLELLNERGEIELELLGLKQQLYLKLLKIQSLSRAEDMTMYLVEHGAFRESKFKGNRSAILRSTDFEQYGYDLITGYLENNEIKTVIPEALSETLLSKLRLDGFSLKPQAEEGGLLIDPSQYTDKKHIEKHIQTWLDQEKSEQIIITDISEMLALEISTINKQQQ